MATLSRRFINWAAAFEDGALIRAVFFGLLTATAVILYLDYSEMAAQQPDAALTWPELQPILPDFDPANPAGAPGPEVMTPVAALQQPVVIKLTSGGVLRFTGTIDPGAAGRFAQQVADYGDYIKTVALDSPGGSVVDALAIGKLIREKGFTTSVARGALCASSCPLVFAGGKERLANEGSAVGVHQIYAATAAGQSITSRLAAAGNAMSDAQTLTAEISRYLTEMGIAPEVWLRALETPPNRLTYFNATEMVSLKLATRLTT